MQKKFKHLIIITSGSGKRQWLKASKYGCQSWLSGISNLDPLIALDFLMQKSIIMNLLITLKN